MMLVRAYPRETQEMVFDAHERAFAFFRGACSRGIYDNMKTAVETIPIGKNSAITTAASSRCARTDLPSSPSRARRRRAGRRAKSRTRSASCGSASSRRACASRVATS